MSLEEAKKLDGQYQLLKDKFKFPTFKSMGIPEPYPENHKGDDEVVYFCGNSLGLMPLNTPVAIQRELDAWGARGVESHFRHPYTESDNCTSWLDIDLPVVPLLAPIVGALETEVACMGTLTMNLNSLLVSFYKPTATKYKILFEKGAFPSDYYAFLNQVKLHNFDENALLQIAPREGETNIRHEDIIDLIEKEGDSIALICFPGIQYYSGQFFKLKEITEKGHSKGCIVGFDLAHAVGNVELKLHEWDVDFAAWCSYKYLNSGPGAIGGLFVHEKFTKGNTTDSFKPRLAGWWGNNASERFKMLESFDPIESALGFRQSNPSVVDVVSLKSSLEIFGEFKGGMHAIREKSIAMTNFLEKLLKQSRYFKEKRSGDLTSKPHFIIVTPQNNEERGAQLSLLFAPQENRVMDKVKKYFDNNGIICDERRPDVIRLAPCPLYNSFEDVLKVVDSLNKALDSI